MRNSAMNNPSRTMDGAYGTRNANGIYPDRYRPAIHSIDVNNVSSHVKTFSNSQGECPDVCRPDMDNGDAAMLKYLPPTPAPSLPPSVCSLTPVSLESMERMSPPRHYVPSSSVPANSYGSHILRSSVRRPGVDGDSFVNNGFTNGNTFELGRGIGMRSLSTAPNHRAMCPHAKDFNHGRTQRFPDILAMDLDAHHDGSALSDDENGRYDEPLFFKSLSCVVIKVSNIPFYMRPNPVVALRVIRYSMGPFKKYIYGPIEIKYPFRRPQAQKNNSNGYRDNSGYATIIFGCPEEAAKAVDFMRGESERQNAGWMDIEISHYDLTMTIVTNGVKLKGESDDDMEYESSEEDSGSNSDESSNGESNGDRCQRSPAPTTPCRRVARGMRTRSLRSRRSYNPTDRGTQVLAPDHEPTPRIIQETEVKAIPLWRVFQQKKSPVSKRGDIRQVAAPRDLEVNAFEGNTRLSKRASRGSIEREIKRARRINGFPKERSPSDPQIKVSESDVESNKEEGLRKLEEEIRKELEEDLEHKDALDMVISSGGRDDATWGEEGESQTSKEDDSP